MVWCISVTRVKHILLFSLIVSLSGCSSGNDEYHSRFLEKYLLDGQRALQENDTERAERMFRLSLSNGEKLPLNDWRMALAEGRLGSVLVLNDKGLEARKILASSINHFRNCKSAGEGNKIIIAKEQGEADSLLGSLLVDDGDANGARVYLEEATALLAPHWTDAKSAEERDTVSGIGYARALYGLARISEKDGDKDGAIKKLTAALDVIDAERVPVSMREEIATALSRLLKLAGRVNDASEVEEKQEHYARFNPGGLKSLARDLFREDFSKARAASKNSEYAEADRLYADALKQTELFAKDGDDAFNTLSEWSRVKQKMHDSDAANKMLDRLEALALHLGGAESVYYDNYYLAKGRVLKWQKRWADLESMTENQIKLRVKLRGQNNFHVGETYRQLGECRIHLDKVEQAIADLRKSIAVFDLNRERNARELKHTYDLLIPLLSGEANAELARKYKFDRALLVKQTIQWDKERRD